MIKYKLTCKSCEKSYDSCFSSSKEYEKLKKLKHLNCPNCDSFNIEKSLMSPNVVNSKKEKIEKVDKKVLEIKKTIKKYQKFIQNNLEYVGENFAYEARSLHYKTKQKAKGVYGKATLEELKELNEEGIETEVIPWLKEKDN